MANPLPNEKELYTQIEKEKIIINPEIWDLLYHRIGDDITAIDLICRYYLDSQQAIPIQEAEKILHHTHHIKDLVNKITVTSQDDLAFPEFIDDIPLHPILREMFTHYIGNDVYMITLIVGNDIDPIDPQPVSLEHTRKVITHTRSIKEFMEKLRIATSRQKDYIELQPESELDVPVPPDKTNLNKEAIFLKIRASLAKEFKLGAGSISFDSRFRQDLGFDSIDTIRVIMCLEEAFGFEMPDDAADGVLTVGQAVDYIYRRIRE
jgi:acyl carrier protein